MNKLQYLRFLSILMLCTGCQQIEKMTQRHTNKLIHESSPYLLQHAHNPVDWYPWGEEALTKAKEENKLLLISIGYSSCHWCHVMEHESFEDTAVAAVMNEHFVCIKVDREERPDIDDVYMMACQLSSGGNCGWPLNSFALPDGRPVWAGTYFPKSRWLEILAYFKQTYQDEPEKMNDYADRLVAGVQDHGLSDMLAPAGTVIQESDVHAMAKIFMDKMDPVMGGRRGAPKFPMPNNWDFLMHYAYRYKNQRAGELVKTTLDKMMMGGIYDQLEGGFARYSTDSVWLVPHFEKMLYDNGQLLSTYANAYAWTGDKNYRHIVAQTISFLETYWLDDDGGFYSSYDADSEGEEGRFYVWTEEELTKLIPDEQTRSVFFAVHDITAAGNWEHGKNILQIKYRFEEISQRMKIPVDEIELKMQGVYALLIKERSKRVFPGLDDKVLTSWNGLVLKGLIDAYRATGEAHYFELAEGCADFLVKHAIQRNDAYRINRNYKDGRSTINGFLDDYATVIDALLAMYQITFDMQWLEHAEKLTAHVDAHFSGDSTGLYYYTSDLDPALIARRIDYSDNVIPAANSIMARNLYMLGNLKEIPAYIERAQHMFFTIWPRIQADGQPSFYSNWCQLMLTLSSPPKEVAIVGEGYKALLEGLQQRYEPHVIYLGGKDDQGLPLLEHKLIENQTFIYVCQNKICKLPTDDLQKAVELIAE